MTHERGFSDGDSSSVYTSVFKRVFVDFKRDTIYKNAETNNNGDGNFKKK